MVHLAFMGCGSITAERHLPEALAEPAVVISGFCNRSLAVSEAFQAQYGGIAYPDFEAVLADPLVDAVVIATPNCFHSSQSVQALRAGKHVLCEKPMAITLAQGEAMVTAAQESGRVLMIGHNQKLEPAFQSAKKILDSGALGRVLSFHGMVGNEGPEGERPFPWFFQKELAGMGVTGDLGIHMVDSLLWLLGEPISQVQGMTAVLDKHRPDGTPIEVEDTGVFLLRCASGALGTLSAGWCCRNGWQSPITLYGTKGVLNIYPSPDCQLSLELGDGTVLREPPLPKSQWPHGSGVMHQFLQAINCPTANLELSVPSLEALRVVLALLEAARQPALTISTNEKEC